MAAPERSRAVNAVLLALVGVAVGLIVGNLLFLLLAARSAVRRMNLWQEATLYVLLGLLLGVLVVAAFIMAISAPYVVEWFNGPCSDEAMRRIIECD
ncbi:MAG TPA: hypothetical protein VK988_06045 [Acidimicrobiales bacterium]|nr:hypothetical protein [Acidimicrobiales bacterium]